MSMGTGPQRSSAIHLNLDGTGIAGKISVSFFKTKPRTNFTY